MGFQSKTYSLSDEVIEALEQLKAKHGSYNKGLRAVLIDRAKPEPRLKLSKKKK